MSLHLRALVWTASIFLAGLAAICLIAIAVELGLGPLIVGTGALVCLYAIVVGMLERNERG